MTVMEKALADKINCDEWKKPEWELDKQTGY
jgi:hypothetical protein